MRNAARFAFVLAILCGSVFSQVITSSIIGTVTDASDALVPGVQVRLTAQATGAVRTATSDSAGLFRFPDLTPGAYTINLKAPGRGGAGAGTGGGGGFITVDSTTHEVTRSPRFWAMAHYSRHVKRGAKVFLTDGMGANAGQASPNPVSPVGFTNPDGSTVVVLSNRGPEKRVQLVLGLNTLDVDLPADSVHTLQWS